MAYLKEIEEHGRFLGEEVKTIHRISTFAIIETRNINKEGPNLFSVFVDEVSIGRGIDSLDHAILIALAYKYDKHPMVKSTDAYRYAARVLQMED